MEDKYNELKKWSDPDLVAKMGDKYIRGTPIYISPRKDKKYMVETPDGKWVHFGYFGMQDYTKHLDPVRRQRFKKRNHKWSKQDKWTAGWLSYHLLW